MIDTQGKIFEDKEKIVSDKMDALIQHINRDKEFLKKLVRLIFDYVAHDEDLSQFGTE
ncbi:MAG: hypothetical protein FWE01_00545 [Firmicutes bacterium]|nr:hypothetical protein [Bacillota bacterium]